MATKFLITFTFPKKIDLATIFALLNYKDQVQCDICRGKGEFLVTALSCRQLIQLTYLLTYLA